MNEDTPRPITASDWRNSVTDPPAIGRRVEITRDKVHIATVSWPPRFSKKWPRHQLWWRPIPFERTV
jgi:hypothetical protein